MERVIEVAVWFISAALVFVSVPRSLYREAWISYLFMQALTWPMGLLAVQLGLLTYPSRFFAHALSTSLTYEFFALPCVSAIYNVRYPTSYPTIVKFAYTLSFVAVLTVGEVVLQKTTKLVAYIHWSWYVSFITISITLHLSYLFYKWFTKGSILDNKE